MRCPFSCVYLQEARRHENRPAPDPTSLPNRDIVVRDAFVTQHADQISLISEMLARAALSESGAVDQDVRDTLEALVRTYRTMSSGLYYDTRPENTVAARIFDRFREAVENVRGDAEKTVPFPKDSEMLVILAFLQRIAIDLDNRRPLGRAFLDFAVRHARIEENSAGGSSLLIHTV